MNQGSCLVWGVARSVTGLCGGQCEGWAVWEGRGQPPTAHRMKVPTVSVGSVCFAEWAVCRLDPAGFFIQWRLQQHTVLSPPLQVVWASQLLCYGDGLGSSTHCLLKRDFLFPTGEKCRGIRDHFKRNAGFSNSDRLSAVWLGASLSSAHSYMPMWVWHGCSRLPLEAGHWRLD